MNIKRHFYSLPQSITGSIVLLFYLALFIDCSVHFCINSGLDSIWTVSLLFGVFLIVCIYFVIADGWASWKVVDNVIIIKKLFHKTKRINISIIVRIKKCYRSFYYLNPFNFEDTIKCYKIESDHAKMFVPLSKESKLMIDEITKKYNVEISCDYSDYKNADEDDDW